MTISKRPERRAYSDPKPLESLVLEAEPLILLKEEAHADLLSLRCPACSQECAKILRGLWFARQRVELHRCHFPAVVVPRSVGLDEEPLGALGHRLTLAPLRPVREGHLLLPAGLHRSVALYSIAVLQPDCPLPAWRDGSPFLGK